MRRNKTIIASIRAIDEESGDLYQDEEISKPQMLARLSATFDVLAIMDLATSETEEYQDKIRERAKR